MEKKYFIIGKANYTKGLIKFTTIIETNSNELITKSILQEKLDLVIDLDYRFEVLYYQLLNEEVSKSIFYPDVYEIAEKLKQDKNQKEIWDNKELQSCWKETIKDILFSTFYFICFISVVIDYFNKVNEVPIIIIFCLSYFLIKYIYALRYIYRNIKRIQFSIQKKNAL